jgi:hypothetical protein
MRCSLEVRKWDHRVGTSGIQNRLQELRGSLEIDFSSSEVTVKALVILV